MPGGTRHALPSTTPVAYDVNLENGTPVTAGETLQLGANFLGIVLTGSTAATLIGRAGAPELLVGNLGPDTIRGGVAGLALSYPARAAARSGPVPAICSSPPAAATRSIPVPGRTRSTCSPMRRSMPAAGRTLVQDQGTAGDLVYGGAGTTVMKSGYGRDTFIGGSGTSDMIDTGAGNLAVEFDKGLGGQDIVTGFDPSMGDYVRITAQSHRRRHSGPCHGDRGQHLRRAR